ncbi:hypothetical protein MFLAVUS_006993 [Mucor flavus]|uniref:Uncharacterized protein n=1 Tax=Mucor flavus TaxID=439312 RepID=A0ABP9Z326_9FUNG
MEKEQEKTVAILNAQERKASEVLLTTNNFQNLWKDLVYEDFTRKDFKTFGKCIDLHTAIYLNWKERSETNKKIQQNLKRILEELEIINATRKLDTKIIREVQEFSEAPKSFLIDKYAIEYLIECRKTDIINVEEEKRGPLINTTIMGNSSYLISIVKAIWECVLQMFKKPLTMINIFYNKGNDAIKLSNDLSTLSNHATAMDTALMSFYLSITEIIETAKDNFIDTSLGKAYSVDIQIESLIRIIQKLQSLLKTIQHEISQNKSVAVDLVVRCNPHFLIDQQQ